MGYCFPGSGVYYDPRIGQSLKTEPTLGLFPAFRWGTKLLFNREFREEVGLSWGDAALTTIYGVGNLITFGAFDDINYGWQEGRKEQDWLRFGVGTLSLLPMVGWVSRGLLKGARRIGVSEFAKVILK